MKNKRAKLSKDLLGLTGEHAVASELCWRGVYAQLTLGNRKKVDLLVDGETLARIEVKAKQGRVWPSVKGIAPGDNNKFLVLVDFQGKSPGGRPDFYVLASTDWKPFLDKRMKDRVARGKPVGSIDRDHVWVAYSGWRGANISAEQARAFQESWDKIVTAVGPTKIE
jgi:hypothetical protein